MCAGPSWFSLCKGNMWFSLAEWFVVLPRPGTSLFLVPRGWWCADALSRLMAVRRW